MQCFANPQGIIEVDIRKPANRNGDYFSTKWEFSLFKDKNNQPLGILGLGQDISEEEKQSSIAKDFSQKMDTIIENITDGFYVLDRDWNFLTMNSVAEDVLGIKFETVEGQSIWKFFPDSPNQNYPAQYRKAMNEQVTVRFEEYRSDLHRWFTCVAYHNEDLGEGDSRIVLKLKPSIAPIKVCVSPLLKNKEQLVGKANEIYKTLKKEFGSVVYDDNGNIGKRYRRQDEIGTPFCVVVDFDTVETDDCVGVRDRDTMQQERVKVSELKSYLAERLKM
jgi:PAS domain S-box-containing protein